MKDVTTQWMMPLVLAVTVGLLPACAGDDAATESLSPNGSVNVSQGGPQDFALFRSIIEQGEVPAPETLEEVGFFAEHAVDLPPADCGQSLCLHPSLAVAPRFDGGNWTMAFVAMNTPVDASQLPRPDLHLVIAVERSNELASLPVSFSSGVSAAVAALQPNDRVSVVRFGDTVETLLHGAAPDPDSVSAAATIFDPQAGVDLYGGLAAAGRAIDRLEGFDGAHRILLLTSGRADAGITDPDRIIGLGEGLAKSGVSFGIVGVGEDYDARIAGALGSLGAGTYSYVADPNDLFEILKNEGESMLYPLATDFRLTLRPAPGYRIGRIYGAPRAYFAADTVVMPMPALFVGRRSGSQDVGGGRRGGGGGLFVELIADPSSGIGKGAPAFSIEADWQAEGGPEGTEETVVNSLEPGMNPGGMWPEFSDPERGKPFMMLNMYLAFRAAVDLYDAGDCARAKGVADMMRPSVEGWQAYEDDPDITEDWTLMLKLRSNLDDKCQGRSPVEPRSIDAGCMFI